MVQVFGILCCFSSKPFFEATCISYFRRYSSAEIPRYEVFCHPSWALKHFLGKVLKFFCVVLMKDNHAEK